MSECTGTAPVTPEPDKDAETDAPAPKPEKKSNIGMILVIFVLAGAAGAAYYYIKFVKGRKPKDEDMDFFDDEGYEEEPYINEDEEQYQTYFLNMVDESDLLALLDDDTAAALTTCNCKEKCVAGQVNTDCPVCKTNMSECTGTAPVTPEPDKDAETDAPAPKPEKKSNIGMILVIFALAGAAGAAYYYIKFVKRCV